LKFSELSGGHFINDLTGNVELRDKGVVENTYSPLAIAPIAYSSKPGTPSFLTRKMSNGAFSAFATS